MTEIQVFETPAAAIRVYLSKAAPRSVGLLHVQTAYRLALEHNWRAMDAALNYAIVESDAAVNKALPRSDEKRDSLAVNRALVRLKVMCKQISAV